MVWYEVLTDRLEKQNNTEEERKDNKGYHVNRCILILFHVAAFKIKHFLLNSKIQF